MARTCLLGWTRHSQGELIVTAVQVAADFVVGPFVSALTLAGRGELVDDLGSVTVELAVEVAHVVLLAPQEVLLAVALAGFLVHLFAVDELHFVAFGLALHFIRLPYELVQAVTATSISSIACGGFLAFANDCAGSESGVPRVAFLTNADSLVELIGLARGVFVVLAVGHAF